MHVSALQAAGHVAAGKYWETGKSRMWGRGEGVTGLEGRADHVAVDIARAGEELLRHREAELQRDRHDADGLRANENENKNDSNITKT